MTPMFSPDSLIENNRPNMEALLKQVRNRLVGTINIEKNSR